MPPPTPTTANSHPAQFSPMGTYQMVAFVGFLELFVMKEDAFGGPGSAFVGDFRNGAIDFGWDKLSAEAQTKKRAIELNNGTSRPKKS